jgi:hypothetical protein
VSGFLEVIAVYTFYFVGIGQGDADVVLDHQFGEALAVYEDDSLGVSVGKIDGGVREGCLR